MFFSSHFFTEILIWASFRPAPRHFNLIYSLMPHTLSESVSILATFTQKDVRLGRVEGWGGTGRIGTLAKLLALVAGAGIDVDSGPNRPTPNPDGCLLKIKLFLLTTAVLHILSKRPPSKKMVLGATPTAQ